MKKYLALMLIIALCAALFVSCKGSGDEGAGESTPAETLAPAPEGEATEPEYEFEVEDCSHNFSGIWKQNSVYHWQECNLCGLASNVGDHTFELALLEKAPTESEDGNGFFVCEVCGILEERVIPAGTVLDTEE